MRKIRKSGGDAHNGPDFKTDSLGRVPRVKRVKRRLRQGHFSSAGLSPDLRMDSLHNCIFSFGSDHQANITSITHRLNELLGATHSFFNILRPGGKMFSFSVCNPPSGFNPVDNANGHICSDVIKGTRNIVYLPNLQCSTYATSDAPDPAVAFLGIETYLGHVVKYEGKNIGSLCVVYDKQFKPSSDDYNLLRVGASVVAMEYARMMVEQEQKITSVELSRYVERVLDVIWEVPFPIDTKNLNYSFVSPSVFKLNGFRDDEFSSVPLTDRMPLASIKTVMDALTEELARDSESGVDPNRVRIIEVQEMHKDGHLYWAELKVGFRRDDSGNIIAVTGITRNIDLRKKAELALKESEAKFRDLAENIPGMAYRLSLTNNEMLFFNGMVKTITGYSADELSHGEVCSIDPLIVEEDRQSAISKMRQAIKENRTFELEYRIMHKDGRIIHLREVGRPVLDSSGNPSHINGVIFDITLKKELENQLQKVEDERLKLDRLESLGTLAAGIAHDFNNVLQGIAGGLDLLADSDDGEERDEMLELVRESCERGKTLANQLVTFARGGSPVKEVISLNDELREWVNFALSGASARPIFVIANDLHNVNIDKAQIRQVLHHLILNADQAMPNGGLVFIKAENVEVNTGEIHALEQGSYVRISICDSGSGIPKDILPKIFELYFSTKKPSGKGIGLSLSHGIIRKHGGTITVDSSLGEGTTVHFYLPISNGKVKAKNSFQKCAPQGFGKILVMDDEPLVRKALVMCLTKAGYAVVETSNGSEALFEYSTSRDNGNPFDLVLSDLTVQGGMGGKELAEKLTELDSSARIIALSGYSDDPIISNPGLFGFRDALAKPYTSEQLLQMVSSAIGNTISSL